MAMKCRVCSKMLASLSAAKRHYREEHGGEILTPEEYLNTFPETEQRDFEGEEPTTDGHNPQYESKNDPAETKRTTLFEHERENDASLEEYKDNEGDTE